MGATPSKPALKPVAEVDTDTLIATFLEGERKKVWESPETR